MAATGRLHSLQLITKSAKTYSNTQPVSINSNQRSKQQHSSGSWLPCHCQSPKFRAACLHVHTCSVHPKLEWSMLAWSWLAFLIQHSCKDACHRRGGRHLYIVCSQYLSNSRLPGLWISNMIVFKSLLRWACAYCRMLKYTPEHMHCLANIYASLAPTGTGMVAIQSAASHQKVCQANWMNDSCTWFCFCTQFLKSNMIMIAIVVCRATICSNLLFKTRVQFLPFFHLQKQ